MTRCWWTRRALAIYQDGELGHGRMRKIEAHLQTCAGCRGELETLRRVTFLLRSLPMPSRPAGYWLHARLALHGKIQRLPSLPSSPLLERLKSVLESPTQALIPVTLACVALLNTLALLELEEEAVYFFASYLLPLVLD